ncbi:hypothetical protein D2U88_10785 [Flagellimonas aequoris]|uniref:Uncharacterized protein n=2 Tax=Flagellimonas aequoris TaxID=2306997 RepID=A0A418N7V2_9FLAO|nr:hypothetical protein D2U88_10785 [Allomuricauda aequoris]
MPILHFAQKQVREILFFNLNPYEMKRMFLTLCGVLFIGSTINASEEIVKLDCHGMVDTLMSNLVAAGAYDGNLSQAVEDWNNLYDTCDALEPIF